MLNDVQVICRMDFHNSCITEICATNNGRDFSEIDWNRVATIAEGNTDVDSVGQFGVGFFSVFSLCEEPIIISGTKLMTFTWQDDKVLKTCIRSLPVEKQPHPTSICLSLNKKYILLNHPITEQTETFLTMNLPQLKSYFTKVLSFTKHINELVIKINDKNVFEIRKTKTRQILPMTIVDFDVKKSLNHLFRFDSIVQNEQTFTITDGPSITLNHISIKASVIINKEFHQQIRHILKKDLLNTIHIELLYTPNSVIKQIQSSTDLEIDNTIFKSILPIKFCKEKIIPTGYIFIGLGTQQTTGIGMHIFSHFIPTIERENLNFQDSYISQWNKELLLSTGQIVRFIYDQMITNSTSIKTKQEAFLSISPFQFQSSVLNNEITFFINESKLFVPVITSTTDSRLRIHLFKNAYLSSSPYIDLFLRIPLVSFELCQNDFLRCFHQRGLIKYVDYQLIEHKLSESISILTLKEFIQLIHYLSRNEITNEWSQRILSLVRFQETIQSNIILVKNLKYYDLFNIPSLLKLPQYILSNNIVIHFSREELQRKLKLTPWSIIEIIDYYLHPNQGYIFYHLRANEQLLSFLSKQSNLFQESEWNKIKLILSDIKCIQTTRGIRIPDESYIPSTILSSSDIPIIEFNIIQQDFVSIEFLKRIGCRTFHLQSFIESQTLSFNETMEILIQRLIKERENMTDADFDALKRNRWLQGTVSNSTGTTTRRYVPQELYFPCVKNELNCCELPIIDWLNIKLNSKEYLFLKELGVREFHRLSNEPWCLGYKKIDSKHETFEIVKSCDVFLDDHSLCVRKFQLLCAPYIVEIQNLYENFGAPWISNYVKETSFPIGKTSQSNRCEKLQELISHRFPILFVNNHCERLLDINTTHFKLLEKNLLIYENDNIRSELTFQEKTIILDRNESMFCSIVANDDNVILYLQEDEHEIEYFHIATVFAQFVFRKPSDEQISILKDKLFLSLAQLKRRNVPVDQLIDDNMSSTPSASYRDNEILSPKMETDKPVIENRSQGNINKDNSSNKVQKSRNNDSQCEQKPDVKSTDNFRQISTKERFNRDHRIDDFESLHRDDDEWIQNMIRECQSYTDQLLSQTENVQQRIEYQCIEKSAITGKRYKKMFYSIPLFIEQNATITKDMLKQAEQLAWVLNNLAQHVFELPVNIFHLFRDINGNRIAFNNNGSLFFNLRYFEQVYAKKFTSFQQNPTPSNFIVQNIVNFYYMVICHELAHNEIQEHNQEFIELMKTLAIKYMSKRASYILK
ncbi:hypothetical protein I4U23_027390 [Adineta vaga]|nr:hypothetical protein I4U23_027390 [Adineta vaga]